MGPWAVGGLFPPSTSGGVAYIIYYIILFCHDVEVIFVHFIRLESRGNVLLMLTDSP